MSDGMTDAARARREDLEIQFYLGCLMAHLHTPTAHSRKTALTAAFAAPDSWKRRFGQFRGDGWRKFATRQLRDLQAGGEVSWAELLLAAFEESRVGYENLKPLSPFRDQVLLFVRSWVSGEDAVTGDIGLLLGKIPREPEIVGGMQYDSTRRLLALPRLTKSALRVIKIARR